jgi:hypothetical protein
MTASSLSVLSLVFAAFALGWNVYRDVVLRARVAVSVQVVERVTLGVGVEGTYLSLDATNLGPGDVIIDLIVGKHRTNRDTLTRKSKHFVFLHGQLPHSDDLPKRLAVGESASMLLPYDPDCFLKESPARVGLHDSFGRSHFAPVKQLRLAQMQFNQDFPGVTGSH